MTSPGCQYAPGRGEFRNLRRASKETLGAYTDEFLSFYFKDPRAVYPIMDDAYISSRKYKDDMFKVYFLRMDKLNEGLYRFLLESGYFEEDVAFILNLGKILPEGGVRGEEQPWWSYYTPELKRTVREKEKLIFALFPAFDA